MTIDGKNPNSGQWSVVSGQLTSGHPFFTDHWSLTTGHCRLRPGFTFIEILATMVFLGIVLPAVMAGISLSLSAANSARRQAQASSLAHSKLMELVVGAGSGQLAQTNMAGDFAPDEPDYRWTAQLSEWSGQTTISTAPTAPPISLQQLDVTVWWRESSGPRRGQDGRLTLSTLVSQAGAAQQSTAAGASSSTGAPR